MFENYEEEIYGLNNLIRMYSGYPKYLPLPCLYNHGVPFEEERDNIVVLNNNRKVLMLVNNRAEEAWWNKNIYSMPSVATGSFFVHYRRKFNITVSENAVGTISFPSHSTDSIDVVYDIEKYCKQLSSLPEEFHPITVCLHWNDVLRNRAVTYEKFGFKVVSVGETLGNKNFAVAFYNLLSSHKYSTSNVPGSYLFYSVELGIPFFLWGDSGYWVSEGKDPYMPKGKYCIRGAQGYQKAFFLFSTGAIKSISREQLEYVEVRLGMREALSPHELKKLLLKSFLRKGLASWLRSTFLRYHGVKNFLYHEIYLRSKRFFETLSNFRYLYKNSLLKENLIPTYLKMKEKAVLHQLVEEIVSDSPIVVEINSGLGAVACFLAQALLKKKKGKLYCVDTWHNRLNFKKSGSFFKFQNNVRKFGHLINILKFFECTAVEILQKQQLKIDFLLINNIEHCRDVSKIWQCYRPLLKSNSIVAFAYSEFSKDEVNIFVAKELFSSKKMFVFRYSDVNSR